MWLQKLAASLSAKGLSPDTGISASDEDEYGTSLATFLQYGSALSVIDQISTHAYQGRLRLQQEKRKRKVYAVRCEPLYPEAARDYTNSSTRAVIAVKRTEKATRVGDHNRSLCEQWQPGVSLGCHWCA